MNNIIEMIKLVVRVTQAMAQGGGMGDVSPPLGFFFKKLCSNF